ncbi:MAG: FAD-dependent oxidoreductase [Spiribacter sp.]|nr:FAD-dependent oxidoreductase [Spiribacter sp.]MDR9488731.1 FAD-dependent oxidoreductase [Spiribacter sp.]
MSPAASIAIVGTGPAGEAAARGCLAHGAAVTVFDEQPRTGGNIDRVGQTTPATAFEQFCDAHPNAQLLASTRVLSVDSEKCIWFDAGAGAQSRCFQAVILACGAYDLHDPLPGLPSPAVSSAGALQALLKGQSIVPAGKIVIAGAGPFLQVVAAGLLRAGGRVTHVIDRLRFSDYLRLAPWGLGVPINALEFMQTRWQLLRNGVSVRHGTHVQSVCANTLTTRQGEIIKFDRLGLTERFVPHTQLARTAGCELRDDPIGGYWAVNTDTLGRTSQPGIYVIGEGQGIRGWRHARLSGKRVVASVMADVIGQVNVAIPGRWRRAFLVGFGRALEHAQQRRCISPSTPDAIICPCEGTRLAAVDKAVGLGLADLSSIKVVTRCGMGPCQGRYCEAQVTDRIRAAGLSPVGALNQQAFTRPLSVAEVINDSD